MSDVMKEDPLLINSNWKYLAPAGAGMRALFIAAALVVSACGGDQKQAESPDGAAEEAGEAADEAAEDTEEAAEEGAEAVEDAAESAGDKVEDATD